MHVYLFSVHEYLFSVQNFKEKIFINLQSRIVHKEIEFTIEGFTIMRNILSQGIYFHSTFSIIRHFYHSQFFIILNLLSRGIYFHAEFTITRNLLSRRSYFHAEFTFILKLLSF